MQGRGSSRWLPPSQPLLQSAAGRIQLHRMCAGVRVCACACHACCHAAAFCVVGAERGKLAARVASPSCIVAERRHQARGLQYNKQTSGP